MIQFRASVAMPTLLESLARVYSIREWGTDVVGPDPDPRLLHGFTAAGEVALGYASEPIRTTARKAAEAYLSAWWARTFPGLHIEREELTLLMLQLNEVYIHHLRAMPGLSAAEEEQT